MTPRTPEAKQTRSTQFWGLAALFLALSGAFFLLSSASGSQWQWLPVYALVAFGFPAIWDRKWAYRLVFWVGCAVAFLHYILLGAAGGNFNPGWLAASVLCALAGGLMATALNSGLWEDNFPPSNTVKRTVFDFHTALLGHLDRAPLGKRFFDLTLGLAGLLLSSPIWIIIILFIWLEDPGPFLFVKNSVGKGGRNFRQYKFRSMVRDAERETGPVLASEDDQRVLKIGSLLRKTALDELPQLLNIIKAEMSFVGPRPQRTILVYEYLQKMPEYAERHRVAPGISGLAQVAGSYYITPRQKLRFDRLYVKYSSLGFDLKLLAIAFLLVFYLRWTRGWNGRVPRRWLRFGSR